ncbi:MAG: hypothetical protein QXX61_05795 [Ignisphaera sp.]
MVTELRVLHSSAVATVTLTSKAIAWMPPTLRSLLTWYLLGYG